MASGDDSGEKTRDELARLRRYVDALDETEDDFAHQLRRLGERLERAGGSDRRTETEMARLRKSLKKTRKDRDDALAAIADLETRISGEGSG